MGILKTVFIGIKGKKTQSIITFIVVLIILLFEITGLLIHSASQAAQQDVYKQIGVSIAITPKYQKTSDGQLQKVNERIINDKMIQNLISKEHVLGYDSYLECYNTPINFENTKIYTGIDPSTQNSKADISLKEIEEKRDQVVVAGGINIKYNNRFYKSQNILTEGEYPNQNKQGAIISEQLAKANNLKIGDTLSVESNDNHNTVKLNIIGTYHTNLKFEVLPTNYMGEEIFRASPYNIIYTTYDTVNSLMSEKTPLSTLTVWVDSPTNTQSVMDSIMADDLWKNYQVFSITNIIYKEFAGQLETINTMSDNLIVFSIIFGAIILIITMTFFGNSYMYENGLYMVLGKRKGRIVSIQLLQVLFIAIAALLVSLTISPVISAILNSAININYVSANSDAMVSCFDNGELTIKQNFHVYITPAVFIGMALASILVAAVFAIIPFLTILRLKPREILAGNKKG